MNSFATMPAHSDQAPAKPVQSVGRPINATEKRAFWSAVKTGKKSPEAVRDYFGKIGIEKTEQMTQPALDAAMKWAVTI